jgi:hypothetical protein
VYQNLQRLYDLYYPRHGFTDFYDGAATTFGVFASHTDAAAFQLAVWEIVFGASARPGQSLLRADDDDVGQPGDQHRLPELDPYIR